MRILTGYKCIILEKSSWDFLRSKLFRCWIGFGFDLNADHRQYRDICHKVLWFNLNLLNRIIFYSWKNFELFFFCSWLVCYGLRAPTSCFFSCLSLFLSDITHCTKVNKCSILFLHLPCISPFHVSLCSHSFAFKMKWETAFYFLIISEISPAI